MCFDSHSINAIGARGHGYFELEKAKNWTPVCCVALTSREDDNSHINCHRVEWTGYENLIEK